MARDGASHPSWDAMAPIPPAPEAGGASLEASAPDTSARLRAGVVYPAGTGIEAIARTMHYGKYLRGIQRAAAELAVDMVFLPCVNHDMDPLVQYVLGGIQEEGTPSIDGLILLGMPTTAPAVRLALLRPVPAILLNRYEPNLGCSWVSVDHVLAGRMVTEHLIARGYRHIIFVSDQTDQLIYHRQRLDGFRSALADQHEDISSQEFLVEAIERAPFDLIADAVRSAGGAAAIFAVSDRSAVAIQQALRERSLQSPRDYGLAGIDNLANEEVGGEAGITSVGFPREEIGAMALRVLQDLKRNPLVQRHQVFVNAPLLIRESSAGPRTGV